MSSTQPHLAFPGRSDNDSSSADGVSDANLEPTRLCDADHPSIIAQANELTAGADTDDERAQRIFYFVRDQFPFQAGEYTVPASQVLVQGHGMCVTKTVLMAALMRAAGFPTRYRWVPLDKRGFFGFYPHWVTWIAIMKSPTVWYHTNCEAFIDEHWVTADGLLDRPLYEGMLAAGHITREVAPTIEWGLRADVLQGLIVEDKGVLTDPDEMFDKAQRDDISPRLPILYIAFPTINRYQERIRQSAIKAPPHH
jgi:Transglutaminase-like superfamily